MKTIRVVAAVIKAVKEDGRTMIFATQRGYGEFKGGMGISGRKDRSRGDTAGSVEA